MHSPNELPNREQFLKIKIGFGHIFSFNRIKIQYLESPYKTNCFNYSLDNTDEYQMNSECIQHCFVQQIGEDCIHSFNFLYPMNRDLCSKCFNDFYHDSMWAINWINKYHYGNLTNCPLVR